MHVFIQTMKTLHKNYHNARVMSWILGLLGFPGLLCCSLQAYVKAQQVSISILLHGIMTVLPNRIIYQHNYMDFRNCFKGDFTAIVVVVNIVIGIVVKIIPKTDIMIF